MLKLYKGLCVLFAFLVVYSTNINAQIKTKIFNDNPVKENSIVVKYDNILIKAKGNSVSPQVLAADIRTKFNAIIEKTLRSGIEEWSIMGDMATALDELNRIPGVRAFPNYVFKRPDVEITPFEFNKSDDEPIDYGISYDNSSSTTKSPIKSISSKEFEYKPQVPNNFLNNVVITPPTDPVAALYEEDFNDTSRVNSTWTINTVSGTNWDYFERPDGYGMLTGDLSAYDSDTETHLISPIFDFSQLDSANYNFNVTYTYASSFEEGWDEFFIATYSIENGDTLYTVNQIPVSDGYIRSGNFTIDEYIGKDSVWFSISFTSDESNEPGFGAFFDNFKIMQTPPPPTSDPLLSFQYALSNYGTFRANSVIGADIDAFAAWEDTTGSDDVIMVVFDDGVDFTHPDLAENAWINPNETAGDGIDNDENGYIDDIYGWSPIYGDNRFLSTGSYHGTHVAGILGAQGDNGIGISGVAQDVSIISVMIFDKDGFTTSIAILEGYEYISSLLDGGVNITGINQSWGGGRYLGLESTQEFISLMTDYALDHAEHAALWIVSAGNDESNRDELPYYSIPNNIQSPNLITVASTDDTDNLSWFSDYGVFTVDVAAPGSRIISTLPPSTMDMEYGYLSGTSMAAPHVSGILALAKAMYPDEDGYDLMTRVLAGNENVASLNGLTGAGGRVNAKGALDGGDGQIATSDDLTHFHRTFIDSTAFETVGIINNTGSDLTVTSISLANNDNGYFFLTNPDISLPTLASEEAFAIQLGFDNKGVAGDLTASLDVSTSAGNVSLPLIGHEQGWGVASIDPDSIDLGQIGFEEPAYATFTLTNDGLAEMPFSINQILQTTEPAMSDAVRSLIQFDASSKNHNKGVLSNADRKDRKDVLAAQLKLASVERSRTFVGYKPESNASIYSNGSEIIFFDDLNDADSVYAHWTFFDPTESDEYWELENVPTDENPDNNVLLYGDFDEGYKDNVSTAAITPVFDFSDVQLNESNSLFLTFDADVAIEQGWDDFYVLVAQDDSLIAEIATTWDGSIPNNSGYNTVSIDIRDYVGDNNIEFYFVFYSDESVIEGFGALFDNVMVHIAPYPYYANPPNATLGVGESLDITVGINSELIAPFSIGNQSVLFTQILNENDVLRPPGYFHPTNRTYFEIINAAPIAINDTLAALIGDVYMLDDLLHVALENDTDPDSAQLYIDNVYDPVYGGIRTLLEGDAYVAPLHKITDMISYVISDGFDKDTAHIYISVDETPHFPTGSDKQYVILEDDSLSLSTVGMAAGVGGNDQDLMVWGKPLHENINIKLLEDHNIQFSADENFFGQTQLMLYVGHHETTEIMDSLMVSLIVAPVNDAPTANFNVSIEGLSVNFTNLSNDALDLQAGGIVAYNWDFGDGNTSTEKDPSHSFASNGEFTVTLEVTDNGGLTATFSETIVLSSSEVNDATPTEFALSQNFPNPFNPSTNIKYSLPQAAYVTISVYNMLGQKLVSLVNTEKGAGYYTETFDASSLSSGVYIYQIKAGAFTETKKMMLIK